MPIKTSKKVIDYLYKCNRESARVWNECIKINKLQLDKTGKFADRKTLQENINGSFSDILYAKCIQVTIKKFLMALSGISQARKAGRSDLRYPYKQKKNYNTMWDKSILKMDYKKSILYVPLPKTTINGKVKLQKPMRFKIKNLPKNITQVELVYDNGLKFAINYFEENSTEQIESDNTCAIDLGEIHAITSIDNNGNPLIITGRQMRSFVQFRNKKLAELNYKLSKTAKGSNNYKKYRRAIRKLRSKTNGKMNDSLNKTTKLFTDYVIENNISKVVIGDLSKFNMNLDQRKQRKGSLQRLVQWNHGELKGKLETKLARHGVEVIEQNEAYTSQTCPQCSEKHKPTGRNYVCVCGYENHRDIVGAINILSKHLNDGKIKPLDLPKKHLRYLRIA